MKLLTSLSKKNYFRELMALGIPLVAAHLAQYGLDLIDLAMMGHLGVVPLAAGTLGNVTIGLILIFCIGIFNGVGVLIANARGANNTREVVSLVNAGAWLAISLSIPLIALLIMIPDYFAQLYDRPATIAACAQYLSSLAIGIPAILLFICTREFCLAMHHPRLILWVALCATPVNAVLNYVLMYGLFGFPELGIFGIGLATAICNWLMYLSLAWLAFQRTQIAVTPKLFPFSTSLYPHLKKLLKLGFPIGLTGLFEAGLFSLSSMMTNLFGDVPMAAHGIVQQACTIPFLVYLGLSQATSIQVSTLCGERRFFEIRHVAFSAYMVALLVSLVSAGVFLFGANEITFLFIGPKTALTSKVYFLAGQFSICVAAFQLLDSFLTISNGALRGIQDTFVPMIIAAICYWVIGLGGEFVLALRLDFGPIGVWVAMALGVCIAGAALFLRFLFSYNRLLKANRSTV